MARDTVQESTGEVPLLFPLGGISEEFAKSAQSPSTCPDARNVRALDGVTGRYRGASREGSSKVALVAMGAAVRQLAIGQFDIPGLTYTQYAQGSDVDEWTAETPLKQESRANDIDGQGNRYAIDGKAGVACFNAEGRLVWKFVLPVKSERHVVRALVVDEAGAFYVGVSEGAPQDMGRIFKFRSASNGIGEPIQEWAIELDGYCEKLALRQGVLYAAINITDRGQSEIRAYRLIDTAVPELAWTRAQVPNPINDLSVRNVDGALFTAHEPNTERGNDPRGIGTTRYAADADFKDVLADYADILWADLWADDIDLLSNEEFDNGDDVPLWRDRSGNERNLYEIAEVYATNPANYVLPTLVKVEGGRSAVKFSGSGNYGGLQSGLLTRENVSPTAAFKQAQRTLFPGHTLAEFTVFMVFRSNVAAAAEHVLGQDDSQAAAAGPSIIANANNTGGTGAVTAASGEVFAYDPTVTGPDAAFDTVNGWCILAWQVDRGAANSSFMRSNGTTGVGATYTVTNATVTESTQVGRSTTVPNGVTATPGGAGPFSGEIGRIIVFERLLTSAEIQDIEGILAWQYGSPNLLPAGHDHDDQPPTVAASNSPFWGSTSPFVDLTREGSLTVKWDPNGATPRWAVWDDATVNGIGGIGYAVAVPKNDITTIVYTHGPKSTGAGGTATQTLTREAVVRRLEDNGDDVDHIGTNTWEARWGAALEPSYHFPRMTTSGLAANDDDGSGPSYLFVPYHTSTVGAQDAVYIYTAGGNQAGSNQDQPEQRTIAIPSGARGYAVSVERRLPEYTAGLVTSLIDEYVFVGTPRDNGDTVLDNVRLVGSARASAAPRSTYIVGAAGATLRKVSELGLTTPTSSPALAGGDYLAIAANQQRLWIADGAGYFVLDPRTASGLAKTWRSKTAGSIPRRCRLLEFWRDRAVVARGEDPDVVTMSGAGDPYDWDLFPPELSGSEAVAFSVGEPVNCLIPYTDDTLLIGTQTRLLRMSGDPANGGDIDRVGDVNGLAFGEPWCRDEDGNLYAYQSRGGVALVNPGGMEPISRAIRRRLEDVDLSANLIRLVWNWKAEGLHVFIVPRGTVAAPATAYFWERRTAAWWQDEFPFVVTSARLVDGDDLLRRAVWMGCQDGFIRRLDPAATDDDGSGIYWSVVAGPVRSGSAREQVQVGRPRFVTEGGALVGLFGGSEADVPSVATVAQETQAGQGDALPMTARGANVWWRLSGKGRFAYEEGSAHVEGAGIRRKIAQ